MFSYIYGLQYRCVRLSTYYSINDQFGLKKIYLFMYPDELCCRHIITPAHRNARALAFIFGRQPKRVKFRV